MIATFPRNQWVNSYSATNEDSWVLLYVQQAIMMSRINEE